MQSQILTKYLQLTDVVYKVSRFFEYSLQQNPIMLQYAQERVGDWINYFHIGFDPGSEKIIEFAHSNSIDETLLFETGILSKFEDRVYSTTSNRLIFPLIDTLGQFVGFSGRILPQQELQVSSKYINTPSTVIFSKSLFLYNLYNAINDITERKYAILVEGNVDTISLVRYGILNVVAPCGTAFNYTHALLLKCFTDKAIICYDSDNAGEIASQKAAKSMAKANIFTYLLKLPSGDPDSFIKQYGKDAFLSALASVAPLETV